MPRPDPQELRELYDRLILHAVRLERLKADAVRGIVMQEYSPAISDAFDDMERDFRRLKTFSTTDRTLERQTFRAAIARTDGAIAEAVSGLRASLDAVLIDLAVTENRFAVRVMERAFDTDMNELSRSAARAIKDARPFNGRYLKDWYRDLERNTQVQMRTAVQQGVSNGETVSQVVRRLRGTRSAPGVLKTTRHEAEKAVRTAMHHTAVRAQRASFEDITAVEQERWVSTLDSRACPSCAGKDGQVYDKLRGPVPPLHPFCRCLRIPFFGELFGTRAAQGGPVDAKETFGDWLKRQPEKTQVEVLGRSGAEVFRRGNLKIQDFSDVNQRPLKVDELIQLEADILSRARRRAS